MLIQLVYVSKAASEFTQDDLVDLLKKARKKNTALGVTGMLLYNSGKFLQALEGEPEVVQSLFESIKKDPRHANVIIVSETPVDQREFGEWAMAFRDLGNQDLKSIEGYSQAFILTKVFPDSLDFEKLAGNIEATHALLNLFKTKGIDSLTRFDVAQKKDKEDDDH